MIVDTQSDLSVYQPPDGEVDGSSCSSCCGSKKQNTGARGGLNESFRNYDINSYVGEAHYSDRYENILMRL